MSKFEQIITAIMTVAGTTGAVVERNPKDTVEVGDAGVIVIRDGQEREYFKPLGGFTDVQHEHDVEIEILAIGDDTTTCDVRYDDLLTSLQTALIADDTLGGLIGGLEFGRPDIAVDGAGGAYPIKGGSLILNIIYDTNSQLN